MGKHIIAKNVRCSWPQLYGIQTKEDGQTFNPGITIILESKVHGALIREIKDTIKSVIANDPKLTKKPPSGDKICLRVPEDDVLLYNADNLILKAGNPKAPVVLHKDRSRMTEADDKIYSGCRVNIKIEIWAQANKWGRRVNAKLLAVQFAADDTSFDDSYISDDTAMEGFGSIDDDGMLDGESSVEAFKAQNAADDRGDGLLD